MPLEHTFVDSLVIAAAVVSGPLLAYLAFRFVWPADARRRRQHLTGMMLNELAGMARNPMAATRHQIWRVRLQHRLLKLIQSVNRSAEPSQPATSAALAVLAIGDAIPQLHQIKTSAEIPRSLYRRVTMALLRLEHLPENPEAAVRSLQKVAELLQHTNHPAA